MEFSRESAIKVIKCVRELGPRNLRGVLEKGGLDPDSGTMIYRTLKKKYGMVVRASIDAGAIGLSQAFFTAKVRPTFLPVALESLERLPVESVAIDSADTNVIFGQMYFPLKSSGLYQTRFFEGLKKLGFIDGYQVWDFSRVLRYDMAPELFDWETSKYVFDWKNLSVAPEPPAVLEPGENRADWVDLYVAKELEADATKSFAQIAKSFGSATGLKLAPRTIGRHFRSHLVSRGILSAYKVYFPLGKIFWLWFLATLKPENVSRYRNMIRRIPYLCSELVDDKGRYHLSVLSVPISEFAPFMENYRGVLSNVAETLLGYLALTGSRYVLTIPYEHFDHTTNSWVFDPELDARSVVATAQKLLKSKQADAGI
ncbi:MAG: hypothetical protein QW767_06080 [Thermoprotei archaeon]